MNLIAWKGWYSKGEKMWYERECEGVNLSADKGMFEARFVLLAVHVCLRWSAFSQCPQNQLPLFGTSATDGKRTQKVRPHVVHTDFESTKTVQSQTRLSFEKHSYEVKLTTTISNFSPALSTCGNFWSSTGSSLSVVHCAQFISNCRHLFSRISFNENQR